MADILSRLSHPSDEKMSSGEIDSCLEEATTTVVLPAEQHRKAALPELAR